MPDQDQASILAVGLGSTVPPEYAENCSTADSARSAVELLRMLRFDLVITADQLPDLPVWQFVQRMRAAWPWQKWALASSSLNPRDEITARTLGVIRVLDMPIDWEAVTEMARAIHHRAGVAVAASDRALAGSERRSAGRIALDDASVPSTLLQP